MFHTHLVRGESKFELAPDNVIVTLGGGGVNYRDVIFSKYKSSILPIEVIIYIPKPSTITKLCLMTYLDLPLPSLPHPLIPQFWVGHRL